MGKHGMVKAVGTHFEYEDGTYYYPFGTTIYRGSSVHKLLSIRLILVSSNR